MSVSRKVFASSLTLSFGCARLSMALRCWNQLLHDWLLSRGLQQSQYDACNFIPGKLYVCFWVDDFLVLAHDAVDQDGHLINLQDEGPVYNLGPRFLGMQVLRDRSRREIKLVSSTHTDEKLERFGMHACKPAATPLPQKAVLGPRGPDEQPLPPRHIAHSLGHCCMSLRGCARTLPLQFRKLLAFKRP